MDLNILSDWALEFLKEETAKQIKFLTKLEQEIQQVEQEIQQEEWARHVAANESEVA